MSTQSFAPDIDSRQSDLPRHVAIIMDGNNRWARARGLPGAEGHRAGEAALHALVRASAEKGIEALTVFAFSSENWRRPEEEVSQLMQLFLRALQKRVAELNDNNVRLLFIGERSAFTADLQAGMREAEARTQENSGLTLAVAVNYGGQWDLAQAARQLAQQVAQGQLLAEAVTEERLASCLSLADLPPPDLLIRTGGDHRISNFLLWQLAYAEFYFSSVLWPDFDSACLEEALMDYAGRQRRFGRSAEQIVAAQGENKC